MSISFHGINVNVADIDEGALPPPSKSFFRADCELLADGFVGQGADARADLLNYSFSAMSAASWDFFNGHASCVISRAW
jgi:hypothetical protein